MATRKKFIIGLGSFLLLLIVWAMVEHYRAKARVVAYRKKLVAAGEKLTVAECLPKFPAGENGGPALLRAVKSFTPGSNESQPTPMRMVAMGAARIVWKENEPFDYYGEKEAKTNIWPLLQAQMESNRASLATLREVARGPVIHFNVPYEQMAKMPFTHLAPFKEAVRRLCTTALLDWHEGRGADAFENLRAAVALLVWYQDDPLMISQLVRSAAGSIAFSATWVALQWEDWTEASLAEL